MYINQSFVRPINTQRHDPKFDILQLIRLYRERAPNKDSIQKLMDLVDTAKVKKGRNLSTICVAKVPSAKEDPSKLHLPKIHHKSVGKIKRSLSPHKNDSKKIGHKRKQTQEQMNSNSIIMEFQKPAPESRYEGHPVPSSTLAISQSNPQVIITIPSTTRSLNKPSHLRVSKSTRKLNLITKCGWNVETKNQWGLNYDD